MKSLCSKILLASLVLLPISASAAVTGYYGKTVSQQVLVTPPLAGQPAEASFVISADVIRKETNWKLRPTTQNVEEIVCRGEAGKGNGNWHKFYEVPASQKAGALADAILGVGETRAPELVKFFADRKKPANWKEFVNVIKEANKTIPGLYGAVITKYGEQNKKNLGYFAAQDCSLQTVGTEEVWDWAQVNEEFVHRTDRQKFVVSIQNAFLLPGEKDTLTVSYTALGADYLVVPVSAHNEYKVLGRSVQDGVVYYQVGAVRNLVRASNTLEVSMVEENGKLVFIVNDRAFTPGFESLLGKTVVTLSLWEDGWFSNAELFRTRATLSTYNAITRIETDYSLPRGVDLFTNFNLNRIGSSLFNSDVSYDLNTSNVRF